jgi:hypothetical protein
MATQLRLPASETKYDVIPLSGGLDLLTPTLKLAPGYVRDALNWEVSITGGYSRVNGYERFDGRLAPSLAVYLTITCALSATVSAGQTITGATSGATGNVLSVTALSTGGSVIAFTQATGTFVAAENITVAAVVKGSITSVGGLGEAADYDVTQTSLAANVYRALIAVVPGSGPIRGVAFLNGITYAWRDNAGGTAMAIYKSTVSGWTIVPFMSEVSFTAGGTAYTVGSTLTQGGVNATVRAVALQSGAWGGTAAGRLIISNITGGNFAAGASVGGGTATLSGVQTAITMLPGGRVQTDIYNFGLGRKIYGCDNVNRAFEFDGTTFAPITTGNVPDTPSNVLAHMDHLFLGFDTNYQHSGITTPFTWTALSGSASYRVNNTITVMMRQSGDQSGGAMSVSTLDSTYMHYGKSALDFKSVPFEESAGAHQYSGERLGGQSVVFADLGAFSLSATQAFGNFEPSSMTLRIRPFTQTRKLLLNASLINREKSQYRMFFSDGYGLYMTIANGKLVGSMPVLFPNVVTCACQGDTLGSDETAFFGSTNGMVYRLDAGTSHDGAPIMSYFTLTYAFQGNSRIFKRWTGASFEVQGNGFASFDMTYDMSYGALDREQGNAVQTLALALQPSYWDSFTWDTFYWDGRNLGPSEAEMKGTGLNVAIRVDSNSDKYRQFTLNSVIVHYLARKALKK